ncbi:MAG: class A beta-lactamase-related serine hydrolase [Negativicutes bacterium]|nr:class A beta-lactamase-related serine hydrolase [Negativicutes bacterium]
MPQDTLKTMVDDILAGEPGCYSLAVKDLASGRQWEWNPRPMRSASLIKIFIMIEAFRQSADGRLNLDEKQPVTEDVQVGGAGPLEHAAPGTLKTWYELIDLMIVESDNTATNMLINRLTFAAVNAAIAGLGCRDTVLRRKMMDFVSAEAGRENYTSVGEMVSVLECLYRHRCLGPDRDETMLSILRGQQDKCKLPLLLPEGVQLAHKTGELDGAEHDAGIVYGPSRHYAIVAMSDDLPDALRGQRTIARLSRAVYDSLNP